MKILGIDIGATHVRYGLVADRKLVKSMQSQSRVNSPEELALQCQEIVASFPEADRVGLAMPGPLDSEGTVFSPPNFPHWGEVNFKRTLKKVLDKAFVLDRDSVAALMAEWQLGAARGSPNVVLLTLGTGIGGAAVVDGKILRGYHGFSGEFGHLLVGPAGRRCGMGHDGCAEAWAGGRALEDGVGLNKAAEVLAKLLLTLELAFDPEKFIISGGLPGVAELDKRAVEKARRRGLQTPVNQAEFGAWSGVIGAALLAQE